MGFKSIKDKLLLALEEGGFFNDPDTAPGKNRLDCPENQIEIEEAIKIVQSCSGDKYKEDKHHGKEGSIHIFKAQGRYDGWYVKIYFIDEFVWIKSFHD
jgi:hypothetical protein